MIRAVVSDHVVLLVVDLKLTVLDAIGDATDQTTEIDRVVEVICKSAFCKEKMKQLAFETVISEHNISHDAILVRHTKHPYITAIV